jgi:hypothetical protein
MREIPLAWGCLVQAPSPECGLAAAPTMTKTRIQLTCEDCYFRREGLCALPGNTVCPTFRAVRAGTLSPPKQPRLVPRPVPVVAAERVA